MKLLSTSVAVHLHFCLDGRTTSLTLNKLFPCAHQLGRSWNKDRVYTVADFRHEQFFNSALNTPLRLYNAVINWRYNTLIYGVITPYYRVV